MRKTLVDELKENAAPVVALVRRMRLTKASVPAFYWLHPSWPSVLVQQGGHFLGAKNDLTSLGNHLSSMHVNAFGSLVLCEVYL